MRDTMLILHFIGLTMGLGTSFAHAFLGKTIAKLNQEETAKFRQQIKGLSVMGAIGSGFLLISGIYLILPFWSTITSLPLLIAKLVLFVILMILILLINFGAKSDLEKGTTDHSKQMEIMGVMTLFIGVLIVILAVKVFH